MLTFKIYFLLRFQNFITDFPSDYHHHVEQEEYDPLHYIFYQNASLILHERVQAKQLVKMLNAVVTFYFYY